MGVGANGDPIAKFVVGVVIKNPYAGRFSEDLSLLTEPSSKLGDAFGERLMRAANGHPIRSYGKSCVVGVDGEYEHGNACLTTAFANPIRRVIGGEKRGYHQLAKWAVRERLLIFPWHIKMRSMFVHIMTRSLCLRTTLQSRRNIGVICRELLVAGSMRGLVASITQMSEVTMAFVDFKYIDV